MFSRVFVKHTKLVLKGTNHLKYYIKRSLVSPQLITFKPKHHCLLPKRAPIIRLPSMLGSLFGNNNNNNNNSNNDEKKEDKPSYTNRLIKEKSPYLLQHAYV